MKHFTDEKNSFKNKANNYSPLTLNQATVSEQSHNATHPGAVFYLSLIVYCVNVSFHSQHKLIKMVMFSFVSFTRNTLNKE